MTALGQVAAVPARAARSVQRSPDRELVDQRPDHRLLDADQRVAGAVVRRRPARVPGACVELGDIGAEPERRLFLRSDQASHLNDAPLGGLVVSFDEATEQGQALDGDQELAEAHVSSHRLTVPARYRARV